MLYLDGEMTKIGGQVTILGRFYKLGWDAVAPQLIILNVVLEVEEACQDRLVYRHQDHYVDGHEAYRGVCHDACCDAYHDACHVD